MFYERKCIKFDLHIKYVIIQIMNNRFEVDIEIAAGVAVDKNQKFSKPDTKEIEHRKYLQQKEKEKSAGVLVGSVELQHDYQG